VPKKESGNETKLYGKNSNKNCQKV